MTAAAAVVIQFEGVDIDLNLSSAASVVSSGSSASSSAAAAASNTSSSDTDSVAYAWHYLSLTVFTFIGFVGNLMVCLAIAIDAKLHSPTNYYLFSLAITDLLVSVLVIPLAIFKNINGSFIHFFLLFFIYFFCIQIKHYVGCIRCLDSRRSGLLNFPIP